MAIRRKKVKGSTIVVLLLLLFFLWLASVWVRIYERSPLPEKVPQQTMPGIMNVLIVGVDQRDDEPSRADTIMIMSINQLSHEAALVSIPRDSRVPIPEHGLDKINHAMQFGGLPLLRQTVENLLHIPIHYYLYTNFAGFAQMVDALGGISLEVEREIIGLAGQPIVEAGPQHLTGSQALSYARFRSDAEGDFGRMRRQQQVMKAILKRLRQPASLLRLPLLTEQFAQHLRTDMSIPTLAAFARTGASQDYAKLPSVQLRGRVTTIEGISYVLLDEEALQETVRRYLRWENAAITNYHAI
ncbi:MAG TPA: LCP family protein [Oscillospiraceae bacterium]|nr:LCP family protein [Oscillospiraceae bacterium]